jgi:hypothetical protein
VWESEFFEIRLPESDDSVFFGFHDMRRKFGKPLTLIGHADVKMLRSETSVNQISTRQTVNLSNFVQRTAPESSTESYGYQSSFVLS